MSRTFYKPVVDRLSVASGEVLEIEDQRYSSTSVHAQTRGRSVEVSSSVSHHQVQKLYYTNTSDGSENTWTFHDNDIDVRKGQHIRFLHGSRTFTLYRFLNTSTGAFWRINNFDSTESTFQAIRRIAWIWLSSAFIAIILSIPLLSLFNVLRLGYLGITDEFRRIRIPQIVLQLTIVCVSALSILPFFYSAAPDFGLASEIKLDKKSILYRVSEAVRVEQTPRPKWAVNQKRILYLKASQIVLYFLIFFFHVVNQATNWYISNGLDWVTREIRDSKKA